jgi:hypothetical protein
VLAAPKNLTPQAMQALAEKAALMCTAMCRRFLHDNMAASKVKSANITRGINATDAKYNSVKGTVTFRLRGGLKRSDDERDKALYVQTSSMDAGRLIGAQGVGDKAKRKIKSNMRIAMKKSTLTASDWIAQERAHKGVRVIPGKDFWLFDKTQERAIRTFFRKKLAELIARSGG